MLRKPLAHLGYLIAKFYAYGLPKRFCQTNRVVTFPLLGTVYLLCCYRKFDAESKKKGHPSSALQISSVK